MKGNSFIPHILTLPYSGLGLGIGLGARKAAVSEAYIPVLK